MTDLKPCKTPVADTLKQIVNRLDDGCRLILEHEFSSTIIGSPETLAEISKAITAWNTRYDPPEEG